MFVLMFVSSCLLVHKECNHLTTLVLVHTDIRGSYRSLDAYIMNIYLLLVRSTLTPTPMPMPRPTTPRPRPTHHRPRLICSPADEIPSFIFSPADEIPFFIFSPDKVNPSLWLSPAADKPFAAKVLLGVRK